MSAADRVFLETFSFGDNAAMAAELASLVLAGINTATYTTNQPFEEQQLRDWLDGIAFAGLRWRSKLCTQ
jgi:uncharacterized protein YhfF